MSALRLLFLLPFTPRLDAPHGGRATAQFLLRLANNHRLAVVCLRAEGEAPTDEHLRRSCVAVEEVPYPGPPSTFGARQGRRARIAASLLLGRPAWATDTFSSKMRPQLRAVAADFEPDVIQLELTVMAQYLDALAECPAPRVLVAHDAGISASQELARTSRGLLRLFHAAEMRAWAQLERAAASNVESLVVFTTRDGDALDRLTGGATRVEKIPLGHDVPDQPLDPAGAQPPTVLFVGGFRHPPNADAADRLVRSIFPRVVAAAPNAVLQLIGDHPDPRLVRSAPSWLSVEGRVDSVVPYLDDAAVVVAPIRLGGGMRVKVLEALAAGKAVVASRRAVEGLDVQDGEHVLLAEGDEEFAGAVARLLLDPSERLRLALGARKWAEINLGWERTLEAYANLYRTLIEQGRGH